MTSTAFRLGSRLPRRPVKTRRSLHTSIPVTDVTRFSAPRTSVPTVTPATGTLRMMRYGSVFSKALFPDYQSTAQGQRARAVTVLSQVAAEHPISTAAVASIPVDLFHSIAGQFQAGAIGDHYDSIRSQLALPPTDTHLWELSVDETKFWAGPKGSVGGWLVGAYKRYRVLIAARDDWEKTLSAADRREWVQIKSGAPPRPQQTLALPLPRQRPLSLPLPGTPPLLLPAPPPLKKPTSYIEAVRNLIRQTAHSHVTAASDQRLRAMFGPDYQPLGGLDAFKFAIKWYSAFDKSSGKLVPNWAKLPPDGAVPHTEQPAAVAVGAVIDRWGTDRGRFVATDGALYTQRALPPQSLDEPYHRYQVIKEIPADLSTKSTAAPGFEERGGATQYKFAQSVKWLVDNGYLREVK